MEFVTDWARAAIERRDMIITPSQNVLTSNKQNIIEYLQVCQRATEALQTQINIHRFCQRADEPATQACSTPESQKTLEGWEFISRMLGRLAMYSLKLVNLDRVARRLLIRYEEDAQYVEEFRTNCMRQNLLNSLDNSTLELGDEERTVKAQITDVLHHHGVTRRCFS